MYADSTIIDLNILGLCSDDDVDPLVGLWFVSLLVCLFAFKLEQISPTDLVLEPP